jgi:hypothetical protein
MPPPGAIYSAHHEMKPLGSETVLRSGMKMLQCGYHIRPRDATQALHMSNSSANHTGIYAHHSSSLRPLLRDSASGQQTGSSIVVHGCSRGGPQWALPASKRVTGAVSGGVARAQLQYQACDKIVIAAVASCSGQALPMAAGLRRGCNLSVPGPSGNWLHTLRGHMRRGMTF